MVGAVAVCGAAGSFEGVVRLAVASPVRGASRLDWPSLCQL
jgi:hypothetical protein